MFPHNSLEQKTSLIKGNVEFLRYLKTKVKNPSTEGFSPYYQSLLIERTKNWVSFDAMIQLGTYPTCLEVLVDRWDILGEPRSKKGYPWMSLGPYTFPLTGII